MRRDDDDARGSADRAIVLSRRRVLLLAVGIAGPLVGGLLIHAFGVHAVYLVASILTFFGAWIVGRELRVRVPAPALSPRA